MKIWIRSTKTRYLFLAGANGGFTLIVLLIAPLGLTTVLVNTLLVSLSSYYLSLLSERIFHVVPKDPATRPPYPQNTALEQSQPCLPDTSNPPRH